MDPFEVEKQIGRYGIALSGYEAEFKEQMGKVQQWKSALAEAANLAGYDLRNRYSFNLTYYHSKKLSFVCNFVKLYEMMWKKQ